MSHQEPRPTPRQRVAGIPQVEVAAGAAAEQLVITVHVDTPGGFAPRRGFKTRVAQAIKSIVFEEA